MPTGLNPLSGVMETLHGTAVADPYRWLEDRNLPETERWIANQGARLDHYMQQLGPLVRLKQRVLDYVDVETVDKPGQVCGRYFYRKRRVREQQPSIFVLDPLTQTERLLVDSSDQGPYTSVNIHRVSADGNLLAYEVKQGGEHSKAIHVVVVDTGELLPDHLERGLARGFAFGSGNNGFYYCHDVIGSSSEQEADHAVRFHRFGTQSCDDVTLLTLPRSRASKLVFSSEGETLDAAFCHEHEGIATVDYYVARRDSDRVWHGILHNVRMPFIPFLYRERLFALRFEDTPNGEIVEMDVTNGAPRRVVVPEWERPINHFIHVQDRFYVSYLRGTEAVVQTWSLNGDYLGTLALQDNRTWRLLPTYASDAAEFFLHCESFDKPPMLFRCEPHTNQIVATLCSIMHTGEIYFEKDKSIKLPFCA